MVEVIEQDRLSDFLGAPFPSASVEAAVDSIRRQCGWHLAPERQETVQVETTGRRSFRLPTLCLVSVDTIRDADAPDAGPFDGKLRAYPDGRVRSLHRRLPDFVEVTFTHGYEEFPAALLPVVADRARSGTRGRVRAESLASRSVTFEVSGDPLSSPLISLFRIGVGPG